MRVLEHLPDSVPFVVAAAAGAPAKLSAQRIVEAVIIAVLSAAVSTYALVKVLDERSQELTRRMDRIEQAADQRYGQIQEDVRRIYAILVASRPEGRTAR